MPKLSKIKARIDEVSQWVNLKDIFGIDFKDSEALKKAIGQRLIDKMVDRTNSQLNNKNEPFKKNTYSPAYENSLKFKAAGKSKTKVNLKLTGDMLASMDIIKTRANTIKLGIDDFEEAPKAYNHQTGDTVPARPFFGLTNKEINEVKSEFKDDIDIIKNSRGDRRQSFTEAFLLKLLKDTEPDGRG